MSEHDDIRQRIAADFRSFMEADGPALLPAIERLAQTWCECLDKPEAKSDLKDEGALL